jgi:hypothetical protein
MGTEGMSDRALLEDIHGTLQSVSKLTLKHEETLYGNGKVGLVTQVLIGKYIVIGVGAVLLTVFTAWVAALFAQERTPDGSMPDRHTTPAAASEGRT